MNVTIISAQEIEQANAITHGGVFHADEVMSTVLLSLLFPEIKICRTFKVPDNISDGVIVYDIGGGLYDHHQRGFNKAREDGIKYSSFGLLWQEFGMQFLYGEPNVELVFNLFDKNFVEGIDAADNGQLSLDDNVSVMTVSSVISGFNPNWDESEDADTCFLQAVEIAQDIFLNALSTAVATAKAKICVEKAIRKSSRGIMVLDRYLPWQEHIFSSCTSTAAEILYVVFPSNRGGYMVNAVPDAPGSFGQRKPLPESWAGLRGQEFTDETGVATANFCHPARFICGADSLEDAMLLAKMAVEA